MAIEGEKQLAITGGESMAGSGDVKDQKKSDSGNDLYFIISYQVHFVFIILLATDIGIVGVLK